MSGKEKLDKSRPFGTVNGVGAGHKYEQDGKKFDGRGILISEPKPRKKK